MLQLVSLSSFFGGGGGAGGGNLGLPYGVVPIWGGNLEKGVFVFDSFIHFYSNLVPSFMNQLCF